MRPQPYRLWLFTVRLWQEPIDDAQVEWRGEVRNSSSGETRYFRNWHTLAELLQVMLSEEESRAEDGP